MATNVLDQWTNKHIQRDKETKSILVTGNLLLFIHHGLVVSISPSTVFGHLIRVIKLFLYSCLDDCSLSLCVCALVDFFNISLLSTSMAHLDYFSTFWVFVDVLSLLIALFFFTLVISSRLSSLTSYIYNKKKWINHYASCFSYIG